MASTLPMRPGRSLWLWVVAAGALVFVAIVLVCGGLLTLRVLENLNREDTPERYQQVASLVFAHMDAANTLPDEPSESEVRFELNQRERALKSLAATCRDLAPMADEQLDVVRKVRENIDTMPDKAPLVGGAVLVGLGLLLHASEPAVQGVDTLSNEIKSIHAHIKSMDDQYQRILVNRLELATLASRFNGQIDTGFKLKGMFLESRGFSLASDTLTLTNDTGRDLHDCTIVTRLKGAGGSTISHVHFVREWPAGATMSARYASGAAGYMRQTVSEVQIFGVQVWSPEVSSPWLEFTKPKGGWPEAF